MWVLSRASHTPGESPFVCRGVVVGVFPGEPYPGREPLCVTRAVVGAFSGRDIPRTRVPFRPDHICVLN